MEVGSSSFLLSSSPDSSDSLHGLKFGKKIYFEDVLSGSTGSSATISATSGGSAFTSARKGKSQGAAQPPRCQVEGCMLDLSDAKPYYSRHKVCGMHSKSPKVIVAGLEKRFCQQCSRFHQLPEFDQGKRSCRRKLAGHNERRRKPPAASLISRSGQLFSSFHGGSNGRPGGSILDFSYPKFSTSMKGVWPATGFPNGGNGRPACHQWQGGGGFNSTHVSLPVASPGRAFFSSSAEVPPDGGAYITGASESTCALSLLSSQPWGTTIPARTQASFFNDRPQMPQPALSNNYATGHSWSFKEHGESSGCSSSNAVRNEVDYNRVQFSGELELALQGSRHGVELDPGRGYGDSHDEIHWSL